jgi:hypothetical protein
MCASPLVLSASLELQVDDPFFLYRGIPERALQRILIFPQLAFLLRF